MIGPRFFIKRLVHNSVDVFWRFNCMKNSQHLARNCNVTYSVAISLRM